LEEPALPILSEPDDVRRKSLRSLASGASVGALVGAAFLWVHSTPAPATHAVTVTGTAAPPLVTAGVTSAPAVRVPAPGDALAAPTAPVHVATSSAPMPSALPASHLDAAKAAPAKAKKAPRPKPSVNPDRQVWIE
jgi:hypothetical protein